MSDLKVRCILGLVVSRAACSHFGGFRGFSCYGLGVILDVKEDKGETET